MQLMARRALVDGLVRYDEAHGFRGPMRHIDISQDWGVPLADIPALGDVAPWRLAVVLDISDPAPGSACSRRREKSGEIEREREVGTLTNAGLHWTRGAGAARLARAGRRHLCRAARR